VGQPYWERLVAELRTHFVQGRPRQGLTAILNDLGRELAQHFPRRPDDVNELTDELSVGP
jgi:putative membrane protein